MVILDMPPIFKIHTGNLIFFDMISWWNKGVSGAPSPPLRISFFLKL